MPRSASPRSPACWSCCRRLLSLVTTAAVLGVGGGHVIDGLLSVGALVAFQTLAAQFNRPFGDLVGLGSSVQTLQAELARLDDVEQHRIDPVFDPCPLRRPPRSRCRA